MNKLKFNDQNNMIELENSGVQLQVWRLEREDEKADKLTQEIIKRYNMHEELLKEVWEYLKEFNAWHYQRKLNESGEKHRLHLKELIEKAKP